MYTYRSVLEANKWNSVFLYGAYSAAIVATKGIVIIILKIRFYNM